MGRPCGARKREWSPTTTTRCSRQTLRLCLPVSEAPQGGMSSFFRNFRRYLTSTDVWTTDDIDADYDVLLANSWVVRDGLVARAKRRLPRLRVLHRIDGSAVDYGRDAASDVYQALVNLLADVSVFQSAYGREATRRRGVIQADGPIVHNPVDVDGFRPDGERMTFSGRTCIAHVAFSTNTRKGAAGVFEIARRRSDLTFVMVGRYDAPPALTNVIYAGYADWKQLPAILRSCAALLTLSENETCPNVVLEALACGLPILYKASGGTPEVVGDCGMPTDVETFDTMLAAVLARQRELSTAARRRAVESFRFDVVFPRYLAAMETAVRRPLPGPRAYVDTLVRLRASPSTLSRWLASRVYRRRPRRLA